MSIKDEYDDNNQNEIIETDERFKYLELQTNKKNIPIKAQMRKMEEELTKLREDQNENKKCGMMLKGDLIALEGKIKDKCNELTTTVIDKLTYFYSDLKRVMQNDKNETDMFKVQIGSLNEDKVKLQKEVVSLQSRMRTCETDIGSESR